MKLSAPTTLMFVLSLVVAILGVLVALGVLPFILVGSVWIVAIGYVILAVGCLFKGV